MVNIAGGILLAIAVLVAIVLIPVGLFTGARAVLEGIGTLISDIRISQLRRESQRGNVDSQYRLAELLRYDHKEESQRLMQSAAEQGHSEAQCAIGMALYKYPTHSEAAVWLARAAHHGNTTAQRFLGGMYENGHGVKVDLVEAYRWYSLAAEGEDDFWGAHRKRDEMRGRLKPLELLAADEAASASRPRL